jgi:hypothetical protein
MPSPYIVESAIIGFSDNRVDGSDIFISGEPEHIVDYSICHVPNAKRIGQEDRCFDLAKLLNLRAPDEFAKSVPDNYGCRHLLLKEISIVRKYRGHACPYAIRHHKCNMSYADTRDISDCIQLTGMKDSNFEAEITEAGSSRTGIVGSILRLPPQVTRHRESVAQDVGAADEQWPG